MDINSLGEFFAEYTPCERLGKEYYLKAIETRNPELLTRVVPVYQEPPLNMTRYDSYPIRIHRHERYVNVTYHDHGDFLELMYQYKGQCIQNIEGQTMVIREAELCFISPKVFHTPKIYDDSILLNILINADALSKICSALDQTDSILTNYLKSVLYNSRYPKYLRCYPGHSPKLHVMLSELILEYFENQKYCALMMECQLISILYYIMREHEHNCEVSDQQITKITPVLPILQYIHDHYRDVSLKDLSQKFSYSEQHICRLIKSQTGQTFNRHLIDLRMSQAKLLLITTNLSFSEIAWYCGYTGDAYFHRLFTSMESMTPMQYRKLNT